METIFHCGRLYSAARFFLSINTYFSFVLCSPTATISCKVPVMKYWQYDDSALIDDTLFGHSLGDSQCRSVIFLTLELFSGHNCYPFHIFNPIAHI